MDDTTKGDTKDADYEESEQENSKKHDITMEEIEYESKRRRHNDSHEPLSLESGVSSAGEVFSDFSRSENLSARSENLSSFESLKEVVSQLQEEVKSKKLSIDTLQSENNSLRLQKSSVSSNPDKNAFQQYKKKIDEYQAAVSQRDSVIGQLQDRLTQCVQQQEYLTESAQQADQFAREIETLKLQLKEATDFLGNQKWLSGVNPKEHMELKHKLISVQQERAQDQAMITQLSQQMHTKTEAYGHLDHKYKLILRNHKQTLDNHKAELSKHSSEMQQLGLEKEGFENRMKEEMSKLEKQHQENLEDVKQKSVIEVEDFVARLSKASEDIEKKNREHEKSKEKSSREIQDLMKQLQTLTQELSANREENRNQLAQQRATLEEQFGQEITLIKQQMSTVHNEELTKLQHTHEHELEEVTTQIDALERVQKEDSQAMVESLAHLTSLNQGLKQQCDVEQEKVARLETKCKELGNIKQQLEQFTVHNKNLEEQLIVEQNRQQNLKNLYNSVKDSSMKEHSELQEQMLYQGEQRLKLEDALSEEQRKVKVLEEQKDLLENEIQNYCDINLKLNTECNSLKAAKEEVNKQLQQIEVSLSQVKDHLKERKEKCEKYEKAYEDLKHEKELWVKEREGHLREKEDISIINVEFQKLEESIKEEIHARIELSKEKENICTQYTQIENSCRQLTLYQEKCHSLTQKVAQMVQNIDAKEKYLNTLKDLKEVYLTVCNDCDLHRSDRQKFSELFNEKHLKISKIISGSIEHDNASTKSLSTQKENRKIMEELKESNKLNKDLMGQRDDLTKNLEEIKSHKELLEIKLTESNSQIEILSTEINQVQFNGKAMENEKNEVEMERDQLMEQYRLLESEYSTAIMKLDREVQLVSQHGGGRSDVGISAVTSDAATSMSDQDSPAMISAGSDLKQVISVSDSRYEHPGSPTSDNNSVDNSSVEGDLLVEEIIVQPERKYPQELLKDEKSLFNEIEKLKITVDEQNYAIGSLENENSSLKRTLKQLELEKSNRKILVGKYQQELSEKLKFQQQVSELKLRHDMLESNLKHAESEANNMKEALEIISKSQEKDNNGTEKTLKEFQVRSHNQTLRESLDNREVLHHNLFNQSQLMGNMREEMFDRCKELLAAQELNETLHEEKNKSEEETRILKAEMEKLKHLIQIRGYDIKEANTNIKSSNNQCDTDTYKSQIKSLEEQVSEKNHSNNKFQMEIKHTKILHQLEKLKLQSEQPAKKMNPGKLSDQYLVSLVDGLERLLCTWKTKAQAEPVIQEFINIQIHKVYSLMRSATNMEDCYDSSASIAKLANQALRPVFTAAIKVVSGKFSDNATNAIDAIEKEISISLSSALESISQLSSVPKVTDVGVKEKDLAAADDQIIRITSNIKEMINLKSQLVTSLNDVEERIYSAIESSLTKISSKINDVISSLPQFKTSKENKISVESNKDITDGLSNNVPLETDKSVQSIIETSFELHEQQQQLVKEFQETTINMCQQAQEEKVQLLQSQKMMVHKILEDNQSKLKNLCHDYVDEINEDSKQPQSVSAGVKELVSRLQSTLKAEVVWVEQAYRELLEQYKHEQSLHTQAQQATIDELKHRLILTYDTANTQNEWSSIVSAQKMEIEQLKKEYQEEIQRLEAQLTADDNQALGHLQNIYNDRDWYKKTVGQVSRITLQLLHYYSIAQHFTGGAKQLSTTAPADDTLHQVDPTTGQVLNLSFLSDTQETQQNHHYYEEGGLSEGLISEALDSEELNSNCESALDSTVMSEGMLDDVDNDEQVKQVLTNSYPQLMSILKGRWDRVNVDNLEKEVQELTISLQAAAGMLKIFILSNNDKAENLSSQTIVSQEQSTLELTQYPVLEDSPTAKESPEKVVGKQQSNAVSAHSTPVQNNSQPSSNAHRRKSGLASTSTDFSALLQDESSIHPISSIRKTLDIDNNSPNSPSNVEVLEQDVSAKSFTQLRELEDISNMSGSFTLCKLKEIGDEEKLNALCEQLQRENEENQKLEVEIHKLRGLVNGYEEEKRTIIERNEQLENKLHALANELESTKNHLSQLHDKSPVKPQSYAAKMEAAKDIKDRMRMVLSAKDKSQLERSELVHRVSELEGLLEELNRDRDQAVQHMKIQITDLAQQLDVADRQLKSSRVFIEEQAGEREKEMEELERQNEKLVTQLKEREAFSIQHANMEKEVESLERDLREKSQQLQEVQDSKEQLEKDLKASWDKTGDLRDIIVSIEGQLESKVSVERDLRTQLDTLSEQLQNHQQQNFQLQCQLDELTSKPQERCLVLDMEESMTRNSIHNNGDVKYQQQVSLSHELDHVGPPSLDAQGLSVLQEFEERVERSARTLEALHLSDGDSISSGSEEDLSVKDHLEPSSLQNLEDVRALSPSHLEHCLGEKILALERATEATIKSHRDLNMLYKKNQLELDDVTLERDILQQQSSEALVKISELEARMEQLRRADHPMAAELRQRITTVQDDLENKRSELNKKSREVDDLKYSLMSVRTKLGEREEELERIQSSSAAPHSLPQTALEQQHVQNRQIQDQLQHQKELVENLKSKLARSRQMSVGGGSEGLKDLLSSEKTAEIENLSSTVVMMKQSAAEALKMLAQQDMAAMQQQLEKLAGPTWRIEIEADESRSTEILRRVSNTGSTLSDHIGMLQVPGKRASAGLRSPLISDTTSQSGDDCATQVSPNITLDSVDPLQTQPEPQLSKVTERSLSMHSADSRLEEDFRASQQMLEEREAEIQQLNEEVEDSVHTPPLISETRLLQQRCEEFAIQVETLELSLENAIATKKDLEDEMEKICQEKERQNLDIEELKGNLDSVNHKVGETESANQSYLQDIQNKVKEIKKLQQKVIKYREEFKKSSHEIQNKEKDINDIRQILVEKDNIIKDLRFNIEKQVELHEHIRKENYNEVQKLLDEVKNKEAEAKSIETQLSKKQEEIRRKDELAKKAHVQLSKVESQLENNKNINKKTHSELQAEVSTLNEQLVHLQQQMSEQARLAANKEEQLEQVSLQLQHVHDELKEKLSQCNTEWATKEEKLQRALADMREEHLQKESKQRNDYSESMTITIKDMTKVINEKEEIISNMKYDYEGALKVAEKERNTAEREASKAVKALKDEQQKKIMLERRREVTDASSDSVEDLSAQVRQELQTSDGLDNSLLAYLSQSHQSSDVAVDGSTRASSAVSDISDRDNREIVANKLHRLLRKISHDGLQMLTLSDQMFLRQHSTRLDPRQRNIIAESRLASPNLSFNLDYGSSHSGDQSSLLQRIGILEQELSKKEKEMKRKLVLVEFRLEQEKQSSKEWRDSREYEKEHGMRLEEELRKERMIGVDQSAELIRLDAQLSILKSQLQKSQDDSRSLAEQFKECDTQLKATQRGLQTERVNFSRVSKLLNHERNLSSKTSNHLNELIKELHNTLDIERNRILDLKDKLCDAEIKALNKTTFNDNNNTTFEEPDNANANILASNQFQLALEREQVIELRNRFEREHARVLSLTEQLKTERSNVRTEILKEQGRTSELTKSIRKIEGEKETLVREISSEQEQSQQFLMRVRELESEVVRLEGELSSQAAAHQVASRKVRDVDSQLHTTYTLTLNKLGEAEGEVYTLKQRIGTLLKEQEVSKEKEDNLKQELNNEKEAIRRLGLSGVSKIKDIDDFFKKLIRENLELCKSVLQLTDERHHARMQVLDLEANVTKLQEKLSRTVASTSYRAGSEVRLEADRMQWGTEKAYLQLQITRLEAEIERMKAEAVSRVTTPCETQITSEDAKYISLHGKYLRSESWRKALIWQKRYLLVVLEGYQDTESHTMRRLVDMANRYDNPIPGRQPHQRRKNRHTSMEKVQPKSKFRVVVLGVIAVCRMRFLVRRWRRRRFDSMSDTSEGNTLGTPDLHSRATSRNSNSGNAALSLILPAVASVRVNSGATGLTPPTKDTNQPVATPSNTRCRSLFPEQNSANLNEYIERLDLIHNTLGLGAKSK